MKTMFRFAGVSLALIATLGSFAAEPVNPDLIPEARAVLDYFESIYGEQSLAGISGTNNADAVYELTGKRPAIVALDLSGWNTPTWGETYTPVVERVIERVKECAEQGYIVSLQFHWKHPGKLDGTSWVGKHGKNPPSGPFPMGEATKPGTLAHNQFMGDLARHADYLEELADARIPILWRPFHEIDGGWFWWTDKENPENTAEMWRIMYDYLVNQRELNNLIWVYSAGLHPGSNDRSVEQVEYRKRFYPGGDYVDIAGIDIYPNDYYGWGDPQEDAYMLAYEIMTKVAPGKMLAMCEGQAIPNPDIMQSEGPRWLYSLPWWGPGERNPSEWVKKTYTHPFIITKDELPEIK